MNKHTRQAGGRQVSIYVTMLGNFQLLAGGVSVGDDAGRSQKIWNLLAYLLIHRERSVPQQELIDVLWPDESSQNPGNALKTLLYRARAMLAPLLGADAQLILSRRGAYSWNNSYQCIVDAEEFAALIRQASDPSLSLASRKDLYRQALFVYKQDFLVKLSNQLWIIPIASYYHSLYVGTACDYAQLLLDDGSYAELAELAAAAIRIEPYHERLHALLIKSLLQQGNHIAALSHYETASELLYRNLGVRPSEELRELYRQIMREQKDIELDLDVILCELQETAARPGAFVCEYGFFREAYRIEARRTARQGSCTHVALLTVSLADDKTPELYLLNETMEQLLLLLRQSLRSGDIIARYSAAQYVLMLPWANYEDGAVIIERIIRAFYRNYRNNQLKLSYKLKPLDTAQAFVP